MLGQNNFDYLIENSLIDVKADDNTWKVSRIWKKTPTELEIVYDGWPGSSTIPISASRLAPFRKFTSLYTGPVPSRRNWSFSQEKLTQEHNKLEKILTESFTDLTSYEIIQYFRGELGIYIENLLQWDYSSDIQSLTSVISFFELVLQMTIKYFKCFYGLFKLYDELGKGPEQYLESPKHALASAYLDMNDLVEKLLSLQPRCRNLFMIKDPNLPVFEISNKLKDKPEYSLLFLHLLDYFVNLGGFDAIIGILSYKLENYACPVFLLNNLLLHIFEDFLESEEYNRLNKALVDGVVERLKCLSEKDIKVIDMENAQKLINYGFPQGLTAEYEAFIIELNCLLIKCPYLEKRIRSLNTVVSFIEKTENKQIQNQEIAKILVNQELLKDLLEFRPHVELFKRSFPLFKLMSQNSLIQQKECEIILNLVTNGDKTEKEAGYKIIEEICEFLDKDLQMSLYNKLESFPPDSINLSVLSEFSLKIAEQCGKICIQDYLMSCIQDTSTFTRTKEALDCIKKIFTHKLGEASGLIFLQSIPEILSSQVSIPQYLQIATEILSKFDANELENFCIKYTIKSKIITNLEEYRQTCENFNFSKYSHKEQISFRLKFLEFILNQTQYKVYLKTKEISNLWEIFVKNPKDPNDSELFLVHLSSGTFKGPLINDNEKVFKRFFLNEKMFGFKKLSIREYSAFKMFFFKTNAGNSLVIEDNQLKCVKGNNVVGLDKLIDIFLNSEGFTTKSCIRQLFTIFTAYSEEAEHHIQSLFDQHLSLFLTKINPHDEEVINKALQFLTILLDNDKFTENLHKFHIWDGSKSAEIFLPLQVSVRSIRKSISKASNLPLNRINFKIGETLYNHSNDFFDIRLKTETYIQLVEANNAVIELDVNKILANSEVLADFVFKELLIIREIQEKTWEFAKLLPVKASYRQAIIELHENPIMPKDPFEIIHCFTLFSQYRQDEEWLARFSSSQIAQSFIQFYLANRKSVNFLIVQDELFVEILSISPVQEIYHENVFEAIIEIIISSFGNISKFGNSKKFFENIQKTLANYINLYSNELKQAFQVNIFQIIEEFIKNLLNLNCKNQVYRSLEDLIIKIVEFSEYQSRVLSDFISEPALSEALKYPKHKFFWKFLLKLVKSLNLAQEDMQKLLVVFNAHLANLSESSTECNNPLKFTLKILKNINYKLPEASLDADSVLNVFKEFLYCSTDNSPLAKCKNRNTRAAAYRYLMSITNHETLESFFPFLKAFADTLAWRSSKNWSISFNTREKSSFFNGMRNLGSTCYMNSLFQQLNCISFFSNSILSIATNDHTSTLFQVKKLFTKLQYLNTPFVSTKSFCSNFKDFDGRPVNPVEQMDVDEFFCRLMDKLDGELKSTEYKTLVQELFGLSTAIEMISDCGHRSERHEMMLNVPVEVKNKKDLNASLNSMVQGEVMERDNAYYCEMCQKKVKSLRRTSFKYLPNFLVFSLRRFEFNYDFMIRVKLNDQFEFPSELNMKEFTTEFLNSQELSADQYYLYTLKGIVIHYGRAEQGHYYSLIKIEEQWFEFNDTQVTEIREEAVKFKAFGKSESGTVPSAYLLIYERQARFGYTEKNDEKIWKAPERNVDVEYVAEKNKKNWLKKMVLSHEYLKFQVALEKKMVPVRFTVEYFLTALLRIERNYAIKFQFMESILNRLDQETAVYILEILCSEQGQIEFFLTNSNFIARKFIVYLCKSCISLLPPSSLSNFYHSLLSTFPNLPKFSIVSQYLELLNIFTQKLFDYSISINFSEQLIRYLTDNEVQIKLSPSQSSLLGYSSQYKYRIYSSSDSLNTSKDSALYLLRPYIPYLNPELLNYLKTDLTRNSLYKKLNSNESLRAFAYLYSSLLDNDLELSCSFVLHILNTLKENQDSRNMNLSLFYLFVKNHSLRQKILEQVLSYFVSIVPCNDLSQIEIYVGYLVKLVNGLDVQQMITVEQLERIKPKVPENVDFVQNKVFLDRIKNICDKLDNLGQAEIENFDYDSGFPLELSEPGHAIFIFDSGRKNWFNGIVKKRLENDLVLVEFISQNNLDLCIKSLKTDEVYPKPN